LQGLRSGYDLLKSQNDGTDQTTEKNGRSVAMQLDELINKKTDPSFKRPPEREIYEEEKQKIDDWNMKIAEQDKGINVLRGDIKELGVKAKIIGEKEDEIGQKVKETSKKANKTGQKLDETRGKLHELLEKYKSADRFCVDIILVCICLGLLAVLYNIIKSKYFSSGSSSSSNSTSVSITLLLVLTTLIFG